MAGRVPGITRTALWNAWKSVRKELRNSTKRDIVDYFEYDIDPDVWINRTLRQIELGRYEPSTPQRFTLAKGNGFSRTISQPAIPDIVLYRAIVELFYSRARRREQKNAYFDRKKLDYAQSEAVREAQEKMGGANREGDYISSENTFLRWLCFDQYRKLLLFDEISKYIVLTDITNFFDSVLHKRIAESLNQISAHPRLVGLLFYLVERLAVRHTYGESLQLGLAVDQFGCSRTLAHILLFSHDERMVKQFGDNNYVRWVDDQNFGVATRSEALQVLAAVQNSLARVSLTPNSSKSKILTLAEARKYFHFQTNSKIDAALQLPFGTHAERRHLRQRLALIWKAAQPLEHYGEWPKVLSRFYRLAAQSQSRRFRIRAKRDLIDYPTLASRIANYMRATGSADEYLNFIESVWNDPAQVYPDVNQLVYEIGLRLEASGDTAMNLRRLARKFLNGQVKIIGAQDCAAIAPLFLLRFGDNRSLKSLKSTILAQAGTKTDEQFRSAAILYACSDDQYFRIVKNEAAKLPRNNIADVVQLIDRVKRFPSVPDRYKARLNLRKDTLTGMSYVDMRSLVAMKILNLNKRAAVQSWLADVVSKFRDEESVSEFDKVLLNRLISQQ